MNRYKWILCTAAVVGAMIAVQSQLSKEPLKVSSASHRSLPPGQYGIAVPAQSSTVEPEAMIDLSKAFVISTPPESDFITPPPMPVMIETLPMPRPANDETVEPPLANEIPISFLIHAAETTEPALARVVEGPRLNTQQWLHLPPRYYVSATDSTGVTLAEMQLRFESDVRHWRKLQVFGPQLHAGCTHMGGHVTTSAPRGIHDGGVRWATFKMPSDLELQPLPLPHTLEIRPTDVRPNWLTGPY